MTSSLQSKYRRCSAKSDVGMALPRATIKQNQATLKVISLMEREGRPSCQSRRVTRNEQSLTYHLFRRVHSLGSRPKPESSMASAATSSSRCSKDLLESVMVAGEHVVPSATVNGFSSRGSLDPSGLDFFSLDIDMIQAGTMLFSGDGQVSGCDVFVIPARVYQTRLIVLSVRIEVPLAFHRSRDRSSLKLFEAERAYSAIHGWSSNRLPDTSVFDLAEGGPRPSQSAFVEPISDI